MTDKTGLISSLWMGLYRAFFIVGFGLMGLGIYDQIQTPTMLSPPGLAVYAIGYYLVGVVLAHVRYTDQLTRIDPPPLVLTASLWPLLILLDGIEQAKNQSA